MFIIGRICIMERCVKLIGILCLLVQVFGQQDGGVLFCQQKWVVDSPVKLIFTIQNSKFPSVCNKTSNDLFFRRSTDGSLPNTKNNCTVSGIALGACSRSFKSGSLGCGCTSDGGGYYVVEYNFIAHADYNGWWSATIDCQSAFRTQLLSFIKLDCDNKQSEPDQLANILALLKSIDDILHELLKKINDIHPMAIVIVVIGSGGSVVYVAVGIWNLKQRGGMWTWTQQGMVSVEMTPTTTDTSEACSVFSSPKNSQELAPTK